MNIGDIWPVGYNHKDIHIFCYNGTESLLPRPKVITQETGYKSLHFDMNLVNVMALIVAGVFTSKELKLFKEKGYI